MKANRESVVSGVPYVVADVSGRRPSRLEDFVGEVSFTASLNSLSLHVDGFGALTGEQVHFNEKDSAGRDLRVWQIIVSTSAQSRPKRIQLLIGRPRRIRVQ